jgi:hypothetical protein
MGMQPQTVCQSWGIIQSLLMLPQPLIAAMQAKNSKLTNSDR